MSYYYSYCYCRECLCMDLKDRNKYDLNEAWCSAWRKYFNPNDKACSRYFQYDESRKPNAGGCYLTTIIHNILEMSDDSYALTTLRNFRNNYMLNNPDLYVMLIEYDVIGPKIASFLANDPQRKDIANVFYKAYILPTIEKIANKKYDEAISLYQDMTNKLKNLYNVDSTIDKKLDINIKTLGKARA